MKFTVTALVFVLITLAGAFFTIYLYFRLLGTARRGGDLPRWFYQIGHAIKGRGIEYSEDLLDDCAVKEATYYILAFPLGMVLVVGFRLLQGNHLYESILFALQASFAIAIVIQMLKSVFRLMLFLLRRNNSDHVYASSKAVWGMGFIASFTLTLTMSIIGLPAKPVHFQLQDKDYTAGLSRGADLLNDGWTLMDTHSKIQRGAGDIIRNERKDHFYYGQAMEVLRDGKSYGVVNLTPPLSDESPLKDCLLTSYIVRPENGGWEEVSIQGRKIAGLRQTDYQEKTLADFFHVESADTKSLVREGTVDVSMQNHDYVLFPRYTIKGSFQEDGSPYRYTVYCQHTIWE